LRTVDLIVKKKEGQALSREEIHYLISGYVSGQIPDYQISSWLMAVCLKGLNETEQADLTMEILESGEQIDLSSIPGICVDKHSTGGVGDKTTLVVAPIIASLGLKMAKMSGRGLGHTGGTLDKLESIPGFQIQRTSEEFLNQVREIGLAVVGQTANITPADKKLYALRDVTGTVESVGLIAGSIMSKKLASGASHIVLDVKVGDGAFMKTLEDARVLAKAMVKIGDNCGRKTVAVLTDMDQPLGCAVGNANEVEEAIETLKGRGPQDFSELCHAIAAELLLVTKVAASKEAAMKMVDEAVQSGRGLEYLRKMIIWQKGDPRVIDDYSLLPKAKRVIPVLAKKDGYVKKVQALKIGRAAMILGAGRQTKDGIIDPGVGVKVFAKVGTEVKKGDLIAEVYGNDLNVEEAVQEVGSAFEYSKSFVPKHEIVLDIVS